jgi:hypothetical protein
VNRFIPIVGCGVALLAAQPAQAASFRGSFESATWQTATTYTSVDSEQGTSPQLFVDQVVTSGTIVMQTFAETTDFTASGSRLSSETISGVAIGRRCVIDTVAHTSSCADATLTVSVTWTASGQMTRITGHGITRTRSAQAAGTVGELSVSGPGVLGYAIVA